MNQRAAIEHLYQSLLGRAVEPDALAHCEAVLDAGGSLDDLHAMVTTSAEYKLRVEAMTLAEQGRQRAASIGSKFRTDNPLSQIPELYQQPFLSYLTQGQRYRPLALQVETVNICNNDCIICPYSSQTRTKQTMSVDLFEKVISDYAEIGGGVLGLTPMTGELFLDKFLQSRLAIARAAGIGPLSAITNGSMVYRLSDDDLSEIVGYLDRLTISVYGFDAHEYMIMTRKPHYDRMLDGIVRLLSVGGTGKVSLAFRHLKKRTPDEMAEWLGGIANRAGVDPAAIRYSWTFSYANWSFFDVSRPLPYEARWAPIPTNKNQCALPIVSSQVLADGTVSFCACMDFDANSSLVLGNIAERSLADMLNSEKLHKLMNWAENGVPEFCKSCSAHRPIEMLMNHEALSKPLEFFSG